MACTHYPARRATEERFPYKVDIPAPESGGERRLVAMLKWCRDRCEPEAWDCRGDIERRLGVAPIGYTRFYFMDEATAEAFRREWL